MTETPLTVASLVDEVTDAAQGYVRGQDMRTSLSGSMTDTDLTFTVTDARQMSVGLVEIEDELIQVSGVDSGTGMATVEPWGRAQGGTTAASHSSGARVTVAPLYPRQRVRNAIYGVLREIFPDVFAVNSTLLAGSATQTNFTMPTDCWHVLRVETKLLGPSGMWVPVSRWRQNKLTSTLELEVVGAVTVGSNRVRVQYMRTPPATITSSDDLTTFGYDYQIRDLVVLGATARLMLFTEPARIQAQSIESHGRAESVPAGSASQLSRMIDARFRERVESERLQLLMRYPLQPHSTR